jgi:antirestriction protein ArdC
MFKDGPGVVLSPDEACYQPLLDLVSMPAPEQFASPSAYYATLFHELIHATGHDSRLARFSTTSVTFGEVSRLDYAHEELVADLGGAFLCLEASIANETVKGHTSYLGSWIAVLEKKPEVLHQVLSAAERAAGWIMGHQDPRRVAETDGPRTTMDLGSFERAADVRFA